MVIAGWGSVRPEDTHDYSSVLQEAKVEMLARETCLGSYGGLFRESMICAGDMEKGDKDTCAVSLEEIMEVVLAAIVHA